MELVKSHNVNNVPTLFKLPNQRPCVFSHHNYTSQSALATPHNDHPRPDVLYKGEVLEGIANLQCAGSTDLAEPWCKRQHTKAVPCISQISPGPPPAAAASLDPPTSGLQLNFYNAPHGAVNISF